MDRLEQENIDEIVKQQGGESSSTDIDIKHEDEVTMEVLQVIFV